MKIAMQQQVAVKKNAKHTVIENLLMNEKCRLNQQYLVCCKLRRRQCSENVPMSKVGQRATSHKIITMIVAGNELELELEYGLRRRRLTLKKICRR